MDKHREDTIKAFDKDYGPMPPEHKALVGNAYDQMMNMMGGMMSGTPPKQVAKSLAAGLLSSYFQQVVKGVKQ